MKKRREVDKILQIKKGVKVKDIFINFHHTKGPDIVAEPQSGGLKTNSLPAGGGGEVPKHWKGRETER